MLLLEKFISETAQEQTYIWAMTQHGMQAGLGGSPNIVSYPR